MHIITPQRNIIAPRIRIWAINWIRLLMVVVVLVLLVMLLLLLVLVVVVLLLLLLVVLRGCVDIEVSRVCVRLATPTPIWQKATPTCSTSTPI